MKLLSDGGGVAGGVTESDWKDFVELDWYNEDNLWEVTKKERMFYFGIEESDHWFQGTYSRAYLKDPSRGR